MVSEFLGSEFNESLSESSVEVLAESLLDLKQSSLGRLHLDKGDLTTVDDQLVEDGESFTDSGNSLIVILNANSPVAVSLVSLLNGSLELLLRVSLVVLLVVDRLNERVLLGDEDIVEVGRGVGDIVVSAGDLVGESRHSRGVDVSGSSEVILVGDNLVGEVVEEIIDSFGKFVERALSHHLEFSEVHYDLAPRVVAVTQVLNVLHLSGVHVGLHRQREAGDDQ